MKRQIFLTVDTECPDYQRINQYIYGKTKNGICGLELILKIGKEYGIPINFFFDVVECKRYGNTYAHEIIDLIHAYGQPVFFHLHPNYITDQDQRTYMWEYSEEEQWQILSEGYEIYKSLCGAGDRLFYRAGRYGVNETTYRLLAKLGIEVVDLSYWYDNKKMCHISADQIKTMNANVTYHGVTVLPNTSYIGFDLFGRKHTFLLNCADSTRDEFFTFIRRTKLNHVVFTMHSWDLMNKWFFLPKYLAEDKLTKRKLIHCIKEAQNRGFEFQSLHSYAYEKEADELLNLCTGPIRRIRSIVNNFIRFQKIAKLNKKYLLIYLLFYTILAMVIIGLFFLL